MTTKKTSSELPTFKTESGIEMVASKSKVSIVWRTDDDENPFEVLDVRYLGRTPKDVDKREDLAFDAGDFEKGIPRIYYFAADADLIFGTHAEAEKKKDSLLEGLLPEVARQRVGHAEAMIAVLDGADLDKAGPRRLTDIMRFVRNDWKLTLSGGTGAKQRVVKEMLAKLSDKEKKEARQRAEATVTKYAKLLPKEAPPAETKPKEKVADKAKPKADKAV